MRHFAILKKISGYINLESDVDDFDAIHKTIEKEIIFKGTNLWILVFAIIVASVGLNMNSTAVIIGAMLISPLMGPINGMGYSIATYNLQLFRKSVKNFSFAVIASIIASTAYFMLSPISTAHSELLARTSPTIYDVLIALFGGLAGIVAISSKHKGNVIPGVAIATALMPPLCTAGYGLASGQFNFFFGAMYLFTINTVFIGISSMFISQLLNFPIRTDITNSQKKKINRLISFVIFLVLIPSIYFGYSLVQKENFTENANNFIRNVSIFDGNYLLKNEIDPSHETIVLTYGGSSLSQEQQKSIMDKARDFSLKNAKIEFKQVLSFDEFAKKSFGIDSDLKTEISHLKLLLQEKNQQIDSIKKKNLIGKEILNEINVIYPQIINCSYAETFLFDKNEETYDIIDLIVFQVNDIDFINNDERIKINNWLKARLKSNRVKTYFEYVE
jgi:uncharacterized hydrophobic protein (TIGR00271 family)